MDGEERDVLDDEEIIFELIQNLLKGIRGKMRLCVSAIVRRCCVFLSPGTLYIKHKFYATKMTKKCSLSKCQWFFSKCTNPNTQTHYLLSGWDKF